MLNFSKTAEVLKDRVGAIFIQGVVFKVSVVDKSPKRGVAVEASGPNIVAGLYVWETGEADMDVMVGAKFVTSDWGLRVDDESLPVVFERFIEEVKNHL